MIDIPEFETKKELLDFLVENQKTITAQKKAILKHADGVSHMSSLFDKNDNAIKANEPIEPTTDQLKVRVVINTTNLLDSHMDVHIPNLWKKSLSENKMGMHLQEHRMSFDKIISDGKELKAYTKNYNWSELGYDFSGKTQALVFDSTIKKNRNEFMFDQYAKGFVRNHSVGMRYVKLVFCVNDESYGAEYEAWEKYYPQIVNPEVADKKGYFWAVTEAKFIEGSAVPIGSNWATPTLDNNLKIEPSDHSKQNNEPQDSTQIGKFLIDNFNLK